MAGKRARIKEVVEGYEEAGRHVEAAWVEFCAKYAPRALSHDEFETGREIFFGGATFVFATITRKASETKGHPTKEQMHYMSEINDELKEFVTEMLPTVGEA